MCAIVAERMKTVAVCKDVRIGMDGGIGAAVEEGGLTPHFAISLFSEHRKGHRKLKTLDIVPDFSSSGEQDVFKAAEAPEFRLIIAKNRTINGRFPASLEANLEGKKLRVKLACTK